MSDFYEEVVGPWHPRDDRDIDTDQAEADRADTRQEALLDRRDLPMREDGPVTKAMEQARVMAMCMWCRQTAALPGDDFCAACAADVFSGAA